MSDTPPGTTTEGFVASMASTPGSSRGSLSSFQKTICLFDWWLTKPEADFQGKKRLGVAGVTSRQKQAVRVFSSAPIVKRHDIFTIETADDVCIVLKGLINEQRTGQNGFPSEVQKTFLLGFPINWEQYAEKHSGEESTIGPEHSPSTEHFVLEETPKKKKHVFHEDRREIDVPKDHLHEVPEKIAIDPLNASNLNGNGADETKEMSVAPMAFTRCSDRLKNLECDQKKSPSGCFLRNEKNVSTMLGVVTETIDDEKPNSLLGITTRSGRKVEVSGKSPIHTKGRVPRNLSAKTRGKMNERRVVVCGLTTENKLDTFPAVSSPLNKDVQNNFCDLGGGNVALLSSDELQEPVGVNVAFLSSDELQEPVGVNVAEKLGDDWASKSKQGHHSQNVGTKAVQETDAKEESRTGKKAEKKISLTAGKIKRKIIFEEQVTPGTREEKAVKRIVSPESLSVGRSRSGRLLLPVLEFWRNQTPVYDMHRKVTGIQEDRPVQVPARGSRSEPQKKHKK